MSSLHTTLLAQVCLPKVTKGFQELEKSRTVFYPPVSQLPSTACANSKHFPPPGSDTPCAPWFPLGSQSPRCSFPAGSHPVPPARTSVPPPLLSSHGPPGKKIPCQASMAPLLNYDPTASSQGPNYGHPEHRGGRASSPLVTWWQHLIFWAALPWGIAIRPRLAMPSLHLYTWLRLTWATPPYLADVVSLGLEWSEELVSLFF